MSMTGSPKQRRQEQVVLSRPTTGRKADKQRQLPTLQLENDTLVMYNTFWFSFGSLYFPIGMPEAFL